jgi:PAS domain S-box-containing protein
MNDPIPILIVDDKIENLVAIESILDSPDYRLVRAQSGQEALLALLEMEFAALVLDVMMPGMSGIELARTIRDRKKTRHLPILLLTAQGEEGAVAGYEAGAVDFLTKPVQPAILRSKLAVFAELFRHRRALADANRALQIETERRRQAQEALRATHDVLLENTAVGIAHLAMDGRWLRANGRLVDITGYSREELLEKSCQELTHRDDLAASLAQLQALARGDIPNFSLEKRYLRKDGSPVWIRLSVGLVRGEDGQPQHFVSVVEDITQRKLAEDQARASLAEKEVLLKEIHHRVKNNLQIFSSLLNLESRHQTNPEMRAMIQEIQGRVRSMAVLHEKLYQTESLATIDLADYLRSLVKMLQRFSAAADAVELRWDLEPITADADTALPLGLVFAEVTTNAFKYAFANRREGRLSVTLRSLDDRGFELEVKDDGPGLPPSFYATEQRSLGIRLVQMFARQLNAEATWRSEPGETVFSLKTIRNELTDIPCQIPAALISS